MRSPHRPPRRIFRQNGFTLVESIIVIVITGILAGIVMTFMVKPVQSYFDSVSRAELTDAADVALRRMTRDVRLALPNSLRVSTVAGVNYIEFIMTSGGGRYRDTGDGSTGGDFLSFTDPLDTTFHVLGKVSNLATATDYIAGNDYIAIYNLGPGYKPVDVYCSMDPTNCPGGAPTGGNVALVNSVTCLGANTPCYVTLVSNPFAVQLPPLPSPSARFQVVPGGTQAVTFACPVAAGSLMRYWNYGFSATQPNTFATGSSALLAGGASCTVEYTANATGRNGLLFVQLSLTSGGETVTLFQQIHVDNAP